VRAVAGPLAKGGILVALAFCPLLIHVALSADGWTGIAPASSTARVVDIGLIAVPATVHTVVYTSLLLAFGLSLRPGRVALITALARKMHGTIPEDMARYTRGVTWLWCGFFAAQLCTSLALFLWAPITAWSVFVNVLGLPLIILTFTAEHAYRMVHLPNPPRYTAADVRRMMGHIKDIALKQASSG
jgi:uncharacterized membrane protein